MFYFIHLLQINFKAKYRRQAFESAGWQSALPDFLSVITMDFLLKKKAGFFCQMRDEQVN